jgi:hypothetical protein
MEVFIDDSVEKKNTPCIWWKQLSKYENKGFIAYRSQRALSDWDILECLGGI